VAPHCAEVTTRRPPSPPKQAGGSHSNEPARPFYFAPDYVNVGLHFVFSDRAAARPPDGENARAVFEGVYPRPRLSMHYETANTSQRKRGGADPSVDAWQLRSIAALMFPTPESGLFSSNETVEIVGTRDWWLPEYVEKELREYLVARLARVDAPACSLRRAVRRARLRLARGSGPLTRCSAAGNERALRRAACAPRGGPYESEDRSTLDGSVSARS
jgi:hypothetical protein